MHGRAALPEQYVETIHVTASDGTFDAKAMVRGSDYRIDVTLDGETYGFGRNGGHSWRRTPNGFVRIIRSDVQGDPLDRWPRALFGFTADGCVANGAALECAPEGDIEHRYEVDRSTGKIAGETTREGSKDVTYDVVDDRHWTIHGFGGDADATVTSRDAAEVSPNDVAIPANTQEALFEIPSSGVANIPTTLVYKYSLETTVLIDGQKRTFGIDTGTTQMLLDVGEAARLGLHPKFGHVVIPEIRAGDAVAHNVAAQTVDLFHGGFIAGLLGNEFFSGHIVHLDDRRSLVQLIDRAGFTPPKDATSVSIDVSEGMPLVEAGANGVRGSRFALDTGSYWLVLSSEFARKVDADRYPVLQETRAEHFLEGVLYASPREMPSFDFSFRRFTAVPTDVQVPRPDGINFPLDGIIGQSLLSTFEWWFDYDDGVAWIR